MSVYLKAAEAVLEQEIYPSCVAIADVEGLASVVQSKRVNAYTNLFTPDGSWPAAPWGLRWSGDRAERRECRVLALCLMAAIAEEA